MGRKRCAILILLICLCSFATHAVLAKREKPNIIVFFVDDLGYTDLGCQGLTDDIKTPHIDRLASEGVRMTDGYITAPQCSPSRAGLMAGRYQQRFDFDNIANGPLSLDQQTLGDRMRGLGYRTGQVGKWHLEPTVVSRRWATQVIPGAEVLPNGRLRSIPFKHIRPYMANKRGFDECFQGELNRYWATYDLEGKDLKTDGQYIDLPGYRLDIQSQAACAFIDRNHEKPFFLYVAHYAPHVPLDAPAKYIERFPGEMPERRRMCLAMMSAVDDGIGKVMAKLEEHGIADDTLVVFTSDNGAPIKINKEDIPLAFRGGAWDGSINDPLNGEKGTLLEGGIRVPFVMRYPAGLPSGKVSDALVSSLDIAATSVVLAGGEVDDQLDGVDLIPVLNNTDAVDRDRVLYWRFWNQAAIRQGDWKLLRLAGGRQFLFNLADDPSEQNNLIGQHPDKARVLVALLDDWMRELKPAGMPKGPLNIQERKWFEAYLGVPAP